jgi:hypothetical protein
MRISIRPSLWGSLFLALVLAVFWLLPNRADAYYMPPSQNPFANGGSGLGGGGNQAQGITRATSNLPNPLNFWQYGQVTGVGPIRGTVRIYNEFGTLVQGGSLTQGGLGGGRGSLPGQGATQGDDPPQGVLLSVNYAAMFLPTQQQINNQGQGGFGNPYGGFGGFPAIGGYPGGFGNYGGGKGAFGNGGNGL